MRTFLKQDNQGNIILDERPTLREKQLLARLFPAKIKVPASKRKLAKQQVVTA